MALALLVLCTLNSRLSTAQAQGTAFTYSGQLDSSGAPAPNGLYDFQFVLSNAPSGGNQVGSTVTRLAVPVTNGLFTTNIDFGAGMFTGPSYWLAISVRSNGVPPYTQLNPPQELSPTPYSIFATTAGNVSGTVSAAQISGAVPNADLSGTYGSAVTLNNVNNSFNGAFTGNGGGLTNILLSADQLTTAPGGNLFVGLSGNSATAALGAENNTAVGVFALEENTTGSDNTATGLEALGGNSTGSDNMADGYYALRYNTTGSDNTAVGNFALNANSAGNDNTGVGSGALGNLGENTGYSPFNPPPYTSGSNNIALGYNAGSAYTANESSNIDIGSPGVQNDNNIIRIGSNQTTAYIAGVITGNGGGLTNLNVNASQLTSIGNTNVGAYGNCFVGPAAGNSTTTGNQSTALGVFALGYDTSGTENTAIGNGALYVNTTGSHNTAVGVYALPQNQSGSYNTAVGEESLYQNTNGNNNTSVGYFTLNFNKSGSNNVANGNSAMNNNVSGSDNTAVGGDALEFDSTGSFNTAVGYTALWKLGYAGTTSGTNNIALGYQAGYNFTGTESSNIDIGNPGIAGENNTIRIGASQAATYLAGTVYANGIALTSDRNAKENFTALDAKKVLAKVISLPVSEWNYKINFASIRHIGPMAQDFHAAFGLDGEDDKHIAVVDEGGVALAAIQGLNQKVEERNARIQALEKQNDSLTARLNELEATVKQLVAQK
jgi:hypothetical protein